MNGSQDCFFPVYALILNQQIKIGFFLTCNFVGVFFFTSAGQKRADATVEVAAEAETEIATATETEIMIETGGDGTVPGRAQEIAIATETEKETGTESRGRGEKNLPGGTNAHPAPRRTKTETLTAGRTNTWTGLHLRSLLLVTSTTARSPASCSLDALFSWRA